MLAPVLALAMTYIQPVAADDNGRMLFHKCQTGIRVSDHLARQAEEYEQANECIHYLSGAADALSYVRVACTGDSERETLIRIYVTYMEKNPLLMDSHKAVGVNKAFISTYPCPTKK